MLFDSLSKTNHPLKNWVDDATFNLDRLRVVLSTLRLVNDPNNTALLLDILDIGIRHRKRFEDKAMPVVEGILADPDFARMYTEGYVGIPPDIEVLKEFPPGTLGRLYAEHMRLNQLEEDLFRLEPPNDLKDKILYLDYRAKLVHDIWHVITGYGTTVADELALQTFTFAQLQSPASAAIVGLGLVHLVLYHPEQLLEAFSSITRAYDGAASATMLLGFRHEDHWGAPIEDIRLSLNLPAQGLKRRAD